MYENPSADKFGPPPGQERFDPPKPARVRSWWSIPLIVLYYGVREALPHLHAHGWLTGLVLIGMVGFAVTDVIVFKKWRDQHESDHSFSRPHLNR